MTMVSDTVAWSGEQAGPALGGAGQAAVIDVVCEEPARPIGAAMRAGAMGRYPRCCIGALLSGYDAPQRER